MKKTFKKLLIILLCMLTVIPCLPSCKEKKDSDKLTVLCTVFPIYDWVKSITDGAENTEIQLLVENGADLHSFQPSFADMAKIKNSDVVIYIGGESDKWVKEAISDGTIDIPLSAIEEMSLYNVSSDSIADTHADGEHTHKQGDIFDEHLWLSVKNAQVACNYICDVLSKASEGNSSLFEKNTENYISALQATDARLTQICKSATGPVIFADRFPFVYLFEDYGVPYYAAFDGCTTDTNADFDTVISLANKLDKSNYAYILTTESPTVSLADKVISESSRQGVKTLSLNSMQSLTAQNVQGGASYISIMESNADTLEKMFKAED